MTPRWTKLAGDLRAARGRIIVLQLAIAIALAGVGAVLGARTVLAGAIRASFASTHPADATLELAAPVDAALVDAVRARAEIEDADRRQTVKARVRPSADAPWQMFVLFVGDFAHARVATVAPDTGAWPPPANALLLERTSPAVMGLQSTTTLDIESPHGGVHALALAGTVHDAGQAPAWQEHRGVGYATTATLAALGEPVELHELLVRFRAGDPEPQARALVAWLRATGHAVREIRVPPARQHPHQGLMDAVQTVLLVFSLVLLALCAIVVATVVSAMLARQVREIGVMKAIGASAAQLAGMYAAFVLALGAVATLIAAPLAYLGAHGMIDAIAQMMNLALVDPAIPPWVFVALAALGLGVPLVFSAPPIVRAARISVRRALADHGARARLVRGPLAIRNALRRPARLTMTLALLVVGGALVMTAANIERGMGMVSAEVADVRRYDVEIRMQAPLADDRVAALAAAPGVRALEAWSVAPAALGGEVMHTHPDGGHGAFVLVAPPPAGTALYRPHVRSGRWLEPTDTDALVLAAHGPARLGDRVTIVVAGEATTWTVVGLADELGAGTGFVSESGFRTATHRASGHDLFRIATTSRAALPALERALAGAPAYYAMPLPNLRSIIDDHLLLVMRAILFVAGIVAAVGFVGLGSTLAIDVAERTRELGVLKAIGASRARIFGLVVGEALAIGGASAVLAIVVALPLTALVSARISIISHPPFAISPAIALWPIAALAGSALASLIPALRATDLSVRDALDSP